METAARLLRLGCASIVLQALAVAVSCILQGLERERLLLGSAAISLVIHVILVYVLIHGLEGGIEGVIYAVTALYAVFVILGMVCVLRSVSLKGDWGRLIGIPVIASAVMGLVVFLMNRFLSSVLAGGILCLLCFAVGLILYVLLMLSMHGFSQRELKSMAGGGVFLSLGRLLRLY